MNDDAVFLRRALEAIRQLDVHVTNHVRANHRLQQLETDVRQVLTRYMAGNYCGRANCNRHAELPAIQVGYCSEDCRNLVEAQAAETDARIRETLEELGYAG